MGRTLTIDVLFDGEAEGEVLRLDAPISFWGGVDPQTGVIVNAHHPDVGTSIKGTILALPGTSGSSGGGGIQLELLYTGAAPAGLILAEPDAILAMGAVVARELDYAQMPVLQAPLAGLESGHNASIAEDGTLTLS